MKDFKFLQKPFKTFVDLVFVNTVGPLGVKCNLYFDNGYGVSVVRNPYSYGGLLGLYELAVLDSDGITYTTPITNDVMGHLTPSEVSDIMIKVQKLQTSQNNWN